MEQFFSYINQMGAPVMMPILFTIIGLCIGMKSGKSLKSGIIQFLLINFLKYLDFNCQYLTWGGPLQLQWLIIRW